MRLFERTMAAGAIRPDLTVNDLSFLFEQLAAVRLGDEGRTRELRHRYLALHLDALRTTPSAPLAGPAPSLEEITRNVGLDFDPTGRRSIDRDGVAAV